MYLSDKNYEQNSATGFNVPDLTLPELYVCWFTKVSSE